MKKPFLYFICIIASTLCLNASIRSHFIVVNTSKQLAQSTQEIASNYLLSYLYPHKKSLKENIYNHLKILTKSLQTIAKNTNSKKTQALLSYFAIQKAEIINLLKKRPSLKIAKEMITLSEIFTEGSLSISHHHSDHFSLRDVQRLETKDLEVVLNTIVKYYIATKVNSKNIPYSRKMTKSMQSFQVKLSHILLYKHTKKTKKIHQSIMRSWRVIKHYLKRFKELSTPSIVSLYSHVMQTKINTLTQNYQIVQ